MSDMLHLRVMVLDSWDEVALDFPASTSLEVVKRAALEAAKVTERPSEFILKFRGAAMRDESRSLADSGVPNDAGLIALRQRRFALR